MLSMGEFIDSYSQIGAGKTKNSGARLLLLGVLAGFFIAMAAAASNTAAFGLESPGMIKLVCGLLFPFGLIMVILTGAELFTGNCLITISVLEKSASLLGFARNLGLVYIGNFIGSALAALACVYSGQLELGAGALAVYTIKLACAKCSLDFGKALILGILCNILVCTAVCCALCAKSLGGRVLGAYIPTSFFVLCGFEHSIANMYYVPAGLFALPRYAELAAAAGVETAGLSWGSFLLANLLPVTLGNIIGGAGFAALIWYCHKKRG